MTTNISNVRRRTRLSPEARRKQLMECATSVFAKRGIGRAGHAEIAEMANVSVATVFNYFNTRDDLVDDVLTEVETHIVQLITQTFHRDLSLQENIDNYVNAIVDMTFEQPEIVHIWLEWSSSVREDVWPRFTQVQQHINETISHSLQQGLTNSQSSQPMNADNTAQALTAAFYLAIQMVNRPDRPSRDMVVEFITQYVNSLIQPLF